MHEGMCNAQNGEAQVHVTRKEGEQCVIDFIPDSYLANFSQSGMFKMDEKKLKSLDSSAIISHGGHKYVTKSIFKRKCKMIEDIQNHPFLNFLSQVIGAVFAVLICCLLLTCCKYKKVSAQYEQIKQVDSSNPTVVDRNAPNDDESSRPQRRRKPDPETFGKRSAEEINDKNMRADTELELGELDVDFA